uniref:Uncharacterized protein n=1 Tax=viral metagenome TaxID=1070528 RepID=A0A6M3L2G2_9ZZZZ
MSEGQAVVKREEYNLQPLSVDAVLEQIHSIQRILEQVMQLNVHYGKIPGCGDKPTLLQAGAEKISLTFGLIPRYEIKTIDLQGGHKEYNIVCSLYHRGDEVFCGQGVGNCSTMETKWRYRKAEQKCPTCGKEAIIKGKQEYGGGWICWKKNGGCGAKFDAGNPLIENQDMGRIEHDNPADYFNTCVKMGKKRAFVCAIITATACSDIFTQDIEENPELYGGRTPVNTEVVETKKETLDDVIPKVEPQHEQPKSSTAMITEPQTKRLYAICKNEFGLPNDTDIKRLASEMIKRPIAHKNEITKAEIHGIFETMKEQPELVRAIIDRIKPAVSNKILPIVMSPDEYKQDDLPF